MHISKSWSNNAFWLRHGDKTLLGIAKTTALIGRKNHLNSCLFRHFRRIRMDIATDAPISSDFILDLSDLGVQESSNSIVPVIFSHGLGANRTINSGTCRDLASFGYMVFAVDHKDLSCSYFETIDGKGIYYCNSNIREGFDLQYRQGQLDIRVHEIRGLIDEISGK
jgi:hypothetical protein